MSKKSNGKRKIRTKEHINADLSVNYVERIALLKGYSVERIEHDYGYDLMVFTYDKNGEIENGHIYFQLKAKEKLSFIKKGQVVSYQVEIKDINLWKDEPFPVIFVIYDASRVAAYWIYIQDYCKDIKYTQKNGAKYLNINIPINNTLDIPAFDTIAGYKDTLLSKIVKLLG